MKKSFSGFFRGGKVLKKFLSPDPTFQTFYYGQLKYPPIIKKFCGVGLGAGRGVFSKAPLPAPSMVYNWSGPAMTPATAEAAATAGLAR